MAKLTTEELLDAFKEMTLIELSEFVKAFEDTFEVTAAAPVAVAAAGAAAGAPAANAEVNSITKLDLCLPDIHRRLCTAFYRIHRDPTSI